MQYLEKICCFFVFARIFLHMCPNDKYEKYVSVLTGWIAFCVFMSPILSDDIFRESYETWNRTWEIQLEERIGVTPEELQKESERVTDCIVKEMEQEYDVGTDQ